MVHEIRKNVSCRILIKTEISKLMYPVCLIIIGTSFLFSDGGDRNIKMFYWKFGQKYDREFFLSQLCLQSGKPNPFPSSSVMKCTRP